MNINYKQTLPEKSLPIMIIGAGGIVRDAHLPAYRKAGFEVFGIIDRLKDKAIKLAEQYEINHVYSSVKESVKNAPQNAIYDLALPPEQSLKVLKQLPNGVPVLIQKPMGIDLESARAIYSICHQKRLTAAVNFQLRFAPFVKAARDIIDSEIIGEIYDMEIRLTTYTPWGKFPYVKHQKRLEIPFHSIHYIDLIRSFLGEPAGVMAKTVGHPHKVELSSTRSTVLFDYGKTTHAVINTNHDHEFGPTNQESFIKWEGTNGAIKAKMGLLLNYPDGVPDKFEYCLLNENDKPLWKTKKLKGSWFPDAFIGTMSSLMQYVNESTKALPTRVEDAIKTMAIVESAYESDKNGGANVSERLNEL